MAVTSPRLTSAHVMGECIYERVDTAEMYVKEEGKTAAREGEKMNM